MSVKYGAQLYTLREECAQDFPGVLRKLNEMGWDGVQIDGLFGYAPEEIAGVLQETGLKTAGMHIGLDRMTDDLDNVLKEGLLFHTKDVFCHYLEEDYQHDRGYRDTKSILLNLAKKLNPLGFRIGYHHHDFEFKTLVDGDYALEYLLKPEQNMFLYPEFDTYWLKKAGMDPLSFMSRYRGRTPLLHFKDMTHDGEQFFAEVGTGLVDFKSIADWGRKTGVEWFIVEQDECRGDPFDSLGLSLKNLRAMEK